MAELSGSSVTDATVPLDVSADAARLAAQVLAEDGERDLTSEAVQAAGVSVTARLRCLERAVAAGLTYGSAVADRVRVDLRWETAEGSEVAAGGVVATLDGDAAALLRVERPLLNLLQRAFGIATLTRHYVYAVAGTRCRVLHTRKTAPGLRVFDVAAVLAGGGALHRLGLDRVAMLKDNHWEVMARRGADMAEAVAHARRSGAAAVHVEVERLDQVEAAVRAGADRLLIDNQPPAAFAALAARARELAPGVEIEATGGITLENAAAYAAAGADYISIGALTHSPRAVNLTLEL